MDKEYKSIHLVKPKGVRNFYVTWTDEHGKTQKKSTGTSTKQEAEIFLAEFIINVSNGVFIKNQKQNILSICMLLDDYYEKHAVPKTKNASRIKTYINNLKRFFYGTLLSDFLPKDGVIRADKIIEKYRLHRNSETQVKYGKDLAASTFSNEVAVLIAAKNFALKKTKIITLDETPHIDLPEKSPPRDVYLTHSESNIFLEACKSTLIRQKNGHYGYGKVTGKLTRLTIFATIALEAAARKTAILELKWFQVDLKTRLIDFNPAGRLQTTKKRPIIPMSDLLYEVLLQARKEAKTSYVCFHPGAIASAFKTAVKTSGIDKKITPHVLRHTWASLAAQSGFVTIPEIASVLGDSVKTTEKVYIHLTPGYLRNAVNYKKPEPNPETTINEPHKSY